MSQIMRNIRVLIADDEKHACGELEYLLKQYPDVQVVGITNNAHDVIEMVQHLQPHVIFLDIEMPEINGIQVAKKISESSNILPLVIFATAHDRFAVQAFELNAVDYLLKPFSDKRVQSSIDKVRQFLNNVTPVELKTIDKHEEMPQPFKQKLAVEFQGKTIIIDVCNVSFAYYTDGRVVVHTSDNKSYTCNMTLQDLHTKLGEHSFFRSHRAYIVNIEKIREIIPWFNGTYNLILEGMPKTEIPVSRQQAIKLKKLFDL